MNFESDAELLIHNGSSDTCDPASGGSGVAKYKLMSPAKLPISRSLCIALPPGLSTTSFLDSPVFLSNDKVPADINQQITEQSVQGKGSFHSQSLASLSPTKNEMVVSCHELSLSTPREIDNHSMNQRWKINNGLQASNSDLKEGIGSPSSADDGYNWRKYGQKLVKGCEFPRSYYKCTHPNCEVKKLFERSLDGQITEIIYKGTHNHPKPQFNHRYSSGADPSMPEKKSESGEVVSILGLDGKSAGLYGQGTVEPNCIPVQSPAIMNDDGAEAANDDDDDPFSKRRKMETGDFDLTPVIKPIREPRVVVQTLTEVDILDDGYRWRKYGQKVVRGNPNPRSYYKCTNAGCLVRKLVERASHDIKAVLTTYEGKHNHDVPAGRNSSHNTAGPSAINGPSRILSNESDTISLDLGVGIKSNTEYGTTEHQKTLHSQLVQSHAQNGAVSSRFVDANTITDYYSALNGGWIQYGTRQNPSEPQC